MLAMMYIYRNQECSTFRAEASIADADAVFCNCVQVKKQQTMSRHCVEIEAQLISKSMVYNTEPQNLETLFDANELYAVCHYTAVW